MRNIVLTLSLIMIGLVGHAQTGIGTPNPDPSAQLDVNATDKGVLIPRVELTETTDNSPVGNDVASSLLVFNEADQNDVTPGYYYWFDNKWQRLIPEGESTGAPAMPKFFYMPAVLFDTSSEAQGETLDLYAEYMDQFTGSGLINSDGAPNEIPHIPQADDLYYYITSYDEDVIDNISIDDHGVMTYDVVGNARTSSFVNIVFVVKD